MALKACDKLALCCVGACDVRLKPVQIYLIPRGMFAFLVVLASGKNFFFGRCCCVLYIANCFNDN